MGISSDASVNGIKVAMLHGERRMVMFHDEWLMEMAMLKMKNATDFDSCWSEAKGEPKPDPRDWHLQNSSINDGGGNDDDQTDENTRFESSWWLILNYQ